MTIQAAVLDLHGTVYRDGDPIDGVRAGLAALDRAGAPVLFLSNDPTSSPATVADDLAALGIDAGPDEVLTSGSLTAAYLRERHAGDATFVVGEPGLVDQLDGIPVTDRPRVADVLLASIDRELSYDRLADALRAAEAGATFLGTDPDRTIPAGPGPLPGSGAIVGAVAATVGREPDAILGKPSPWAAERVLDRLGVPPSACLVVGDRLDTDVALGAEMGARTALVETGIHDREDVPGADVEPDHVLGSLAEVERLL